MIPGLRLLHSGKVRDLYAVDDEHLLVVASDRVSAFDHVLPTPIPGKGAVLTALTVWWLERLHDLVPHHLVTAQVEEYPASLADHADLLRGRSMLVRRLAMIPVECVARGYLTGSGYADYLASGEVCGVPLPAGLADGSRLPQPVFTPASKAPVGEHDENVPYEAVVALVGEDDAEELRRITLAVYERAAAVARERGIIVADTKLEFGRDDSGRLILADEVLTPDSSRFWPADLWEPGRSQPSFDKQFVRDWLVHESGWDRISGDPPPALPGAVVAATRARYLEAYQRLTGTPFPDR